MIIINDMEQGSDRWFRCKSGVVSASRSAEFSTESKLAPMPDSVEYTKEPKYHRYFYNKTEYTGTNKLKVETEIRKTLPRIYGDMRQTYMAELVAQVATGLIPEEMSFKQCEWGKDWEDVARAHLELALNVDVDVPAFIYKDDEMRFGISPDGLIKGLYKGKKVGVELKCPFTTRVYIEFLTCEKIKQMYIEQCQFSIWVTGYDAWVFANYDPRMKVKSKRLHHVLVERDQKYMDKYDNASIQFIKDMDKMLLKSGVEFKSQWDD